MFALIIALTSCFELDKKVLVNQNFNEGDWLFINKNDDENTLQIINDEKILQANKSGIRITPEGDCKRRDGLCNELVLYKDGELVTEYQYSTRSKLYESSEIIKSYKNAITQIIYPSDEAEFKQLWDSLINIGNYPTIFYADIDEKQVIQVYKIKEK